MIKAFKGERMSSHLIVEQKLEGGKALTADSWQGMELAGGSIFTSGFHVLDQTLLTHV